jgi:hypothetical protein
MGKQKRTLREQTLLKIAEAFHNTRHLASEPTDKLLCQRGRASFVRALYDQHLNPVAEDQP